MMAERWRTGLRLFATSADAPRARRATDVVLLTAGSAALVVASMVESPQPGFAQALATFAASLPDVLAGLWQVALDLLALLAVAVVVAALVRRRLVLVRDLAVAVALAAVAWLVTGRLVEGSWPAVWEGLRSAGPPPWYPSPRIAVPAAIVMAASPHLTKPVRRLGRWLVALAAVGATVLGVTSPIGAAAGVLVALVAASATHLIFGSSGGRPSLADVESSLAELGCACAAWGWPRAGRPGCSSSTRSTRRVTRSWSRCTAATRTTRRSRPRSGAPSGTASRATRSPSAGASRSSARRSSPCWPPRPAWRPTAW
jgi:hypothetical protein